MWRIGITRFGQLPPWSRLRALFTEWRQRIRLRYEVERLTERELADMPWQIAVGSDLQNPGVEGKRTIQVRFINWYIAKSFQAAQYDGVLATKFLEVANLMK